MDVPPPLTPPTSYLPKPLVRIFSDMDHAADLTPPGKGPLLTAAPAHTPPVQVPLPTPPPLLRQSSVVSNPYANLHINHFTDCEAEIVEKQSNSQFVKAWIFFYRFCLQDPLTFALVK